MKQKALFWGNFINNEGYENILAVKQLQNALVYAINNMHVHATDSSVEYAKICERNLYLQISLEEKAQYENWLIKLEVMDHLKRTRIFFQSLK